MSTTTVALTPASQAAQYLHCSLAELDERIRANGGEPQRIGGTNYYLWDDVAGLRRPARPVAGSSTGKRATMPAATKASGVPRQREAKKPQPAPTATAGRQGVNVREVVRTVPGVKAVQPATVDNGSAASRGPAFVPAQPKTAQERTEAEIANMAKLPKHELVVTAHALGMEPPYPHFRSDIARYIVQAQAKTRRDDRVSPGQAGKDQLAARRRNRQAKPVPVAFKTAQ